MAFLNNLGKLLVLFGTLLAVFIQISPDAEKDRIATPNISAKEAVGTTAHTVKIHARADEVWRELINFEEYPTWSTSVPKVEWEDAVLKDGNNGTITVDIPGKGPQDFPLVIISIDHSARRLVWKGKVDLPLWAFDGARVQEVVDLLDDTEWCEYRSWDTWRGPLAYILQWTHKRWSAVVQENWMEKEVKPYMERKHR